MNDIFLAIFSNLIRIGQITNKITKECRYISLFIFKNSASSNRLDCIPNHQPNPDGLDNASISEKIDDKMVYLRVDVLIEQIDQIIDHFR